MCFLNKVDIYLTWTFFFFFGVKERETPSKFRLISLSLLQTSSHLSLSLSLSLSQWHHSSPGSQPPFTIVTSHPWLQFEESNMLHSQLIFSPNSDLNANLLLLCCLFLLFFFGCLIWFVFCG